MNRIFIVLLICLPIVSSERRREILNGCHDSQKKTLISRFIQGVQAYSPHMTFGGVMGAQLCITLIDTVGEAGCSNSIELLMKSAVCCCACGTCCACVACNECRKEWKRHEKK